MTSQDDSTLGVSADTRLAALLDELTERLRRQEPVELEEICQAHPDLQRELRQLWGTILLADVAGSSGDATNSRLSAPGPAAEMPQRLGDYQLLEEIGRGGMGVVYRARQESLQRHVAIKMIRNDALSSETERRRFLAEAQAVATLDHDGIVPVYEIGEQEGTPYFCMKFVEGSTLADRLMTEILPSREAAALMSRISRAVEHAHQQGILHRDLKPSNILLDADNRPHVTDFGLAKQMEDDSSLTRSGSVIGTPSYMSPEQATGRVDEISTASDIYSLGCILYHMITGRPPFQAASPVDTILMVVEQDPVPPRLLNREADRDLEMITLKCLQKPPDLRYSSAAALADDIDAYLNDEPVSVRSGRFMQVMARWFRETHHAPVLENWGLLWMWHSLALFVACLLTNVLYWVGVQSRWYYFGLWTVGIGTCAAVFWALRRRMGPVTFVERQIAHVWAGSMICVAALFPLEAWLGLELLQMSPVIALICGYVFLIKGGILSGTFYVQAICLFLTAALMTLLPNFAHFVFGCVAAICFLVPGIKYYRVRKRNQVEKDAGHRGSVRRVSPQDSR